MNKLNKITWELFLIFGILLIIGGYFFKKYNLCGMGLCFLLLGVVDLLIKKYNKKEK